MTQTQIDELLAGQWYVRVTSLSHPDGEIRGQIILVPETSTFGLLALGGGALLARSWWRHRQGRAAIHPAVLALVLAGFLPCGTQAQGNLEFRAILPDDFAPDPLHWFSMPPGQGRLYVEPGQLRFTVIYIGIRYVPYVGHLHAAAPSGEQSRSLDLLAFGTRTGANFGDGNWGSIYRGAIPLAQFTTTELDGLAAGRWQLRFSTPDNLSDYLGGTFVAVPEPSVLALAAIAVACALCLRSRSGR